MAVQTTDVLYNKVSRYNISGNEEGFVMGGEEAGIFAAGCARMPLDVMRTAQSGTAAALKAVQTVKGR